MNGRYYHSPNTVKYWVQINIIILRSVLTSNSCSDTLQDLLGYRDIGLFSEGLFENCEF